MTNFLQIAAVGGVLTLSISGGIGASLALSEASPESAARPATEAAGIQLAQTSSDDDLLLDEDLLSEDELLGDDDLLLEEEVVTEEEAPEEEAAPDAFQEHAELFIENRYPSANTCAVCHPKQYEEWAVSQHAYAQLSPVYMAMQTTINIKTSGTNGDFCIRCHNQVGMNLGESVYVSNLERPATSREGITCVVCHRVKHSYGKASGRYALAEGDLFDPVLGPRGNDELKRVLSKPEEYRVVTERDQAGRAIHTEAKKFFQLTTSGFCGTCHDVTLFDGFRLEEAFAEYKRTPAARRGVSCQDCHMGKVQGVVSDYDHGPAAIVGGVPTMPRKLTNHFFAGPDYSVVHPGIFPHNVKAAELKTPREWLEFDYEAGWGTDAFEDNVADDYRFPDSWFSIDDRYDAREIIEQQFERLEWARQKRLEVLRNGFGAGEIAVEQADEDGIELTVEVVNLTDGHGVPTGFDAERLNFLEVTVTDQAGKVVYASGDRDPNGDVRDAHSRYVHDGLLPLDEDLFSLQSKFIVRLFRGGEREQILAVNESVSALPFIRPERRSNILYGRPSGARKHKKNIDPLGSRTARYRVDGDKLTGPGTYNVSIRFIAQMVPVNLLSAIQVAGFDYGLSPRTIADRVVENAHVIWERHLVVDTRTGKTQEVKLTKAGTF